LTTLRLNGPAFRAGLGDRHVLFLEPLPPTAAHVLVVAVVGLQTQQSISGLAPSPRVLSGAGSSRLVIQVTAYSFGLAGEQQASEPLLDCIRFVHLGNRAILPAR